MTLKIEWRPIKTTSLIPGNRPRRLPIAITAVVVLLIAVIALAGRTPSNSPAPAPASDNAPRTQTMHSRQGAETVAARLAEKFGSEVMFGEHGRRGLIEETVVPQRREQMIADADADYSRLARQIGLDDQGRPPAGAKFVSRTTAVHTTVRHYEDDAAEVEVWCSATFGLTGKNITEIPPSTSWLTMTLTLNWHQSDGWLLADLQQRDGPEPGTAGAPK